MEHNNLTVKIIGNDKFVIYNGENEVVVKLVVSNGRLYVADNYGKKISTIPTEFAVKSLVDLYQKGSWFIVCTVQFVNDETERYDLDIEDVLTIMRSDDCEKPSRKEDGMHKHHNHHDCCNNGMHVDMTKYVTLREFYNDRNDRLFSENDLQNQIDKINNIAIRKLNHRIDDTNEVLEGNVYKTDSLDHDLRELDKRVSEAECKNNCNFKRIDESIDRLNHDVEEIISEQSNFETKEHAKATYATKEEVEEGYQPKGDYLTEHQDLSEYAKTEYVDGELAKKLDASTYETDKATFETKENAEATYATKEDLNGVLRINENGSFSMPNCTSEGDNSHAEGVGTISKGQTSHAEGFETSAQASYAHSEGYKTQAKSQGSHAEGGETIANGYYSHAEGYKTSAKGHRSHAEGEGTIANNQAEHAEGMWNVSNSDTLSSIGNGKDDANRHNAFEVKKDGTIYISDVNAEGEDFKKPMVNLQETLENKATIEYVDSKFLTTDTNGYEYVDMGLPSGNLWATCNVGATKPEEYGLYFAWGETEGYKNASSRSFTWETYKFGGTTTNNSQSKYNSTDGLVVLEPEDDAAKVSMGGNWRMATNTEFKELFDNTEPGDGANSYGWVTNYNGTGVKGVLRKSKTNGNTIFFPAGGNADDTSVYQIGSYGHYWHSSLYTSSNCNAYALDFSSYGLSPQYHSYRLYGFSIRGVIQPTQSPLNKYLTKEEAKEIYVTKENLIKELDSSLEGMTTDDATNLFNKIFN